MSDTDAEKKPRKRTAKKILEILERGNRILELRKGGASLRKISALLTNQAEDEGRPTRGYSYEQVRIDYWEILTLKIEEQQDAAEEVRALCGERLDDVILNVSPLLRSLDPEIKIKAANALARIGKEYAELYGAKKPTKVAMTDADGESVNPVTHIVVEFSDAVEKK